MDIAHMEFVPPSHPNGARTSEHVVQFYETDAFLVSSVYEFIERGLHDGDTGIVIARQYVREGLADRLREDGFNVAALVDAGQYISLDAAETLSQFMLGGSLQRERGAQILEEIIARAETGGRRLRIFGEMVALLWTAGNRNAALDLEELWNELGKSHTFSLSCGYPMSSFAREHHAGWLHDVCSEHSRVIPAESYSVLTDPEERLRAIALLQQKAHALEAEVKQRKAAQEALSRSLQLRDDFLSTVSHDLRTPLTVLQGQAQLLLRRAARGNLDQDVVLKGLETIETKTRMMTELVDELLDVTRLRAGQELQLDRRPADLATLVQSAVEACKGISSRHTVLVRADEAGLRGFWDRKRLRRVLENLIGNAIKYTPDGGEVTVTVARESTADGDEAVVTVRDRGIGIAEDDLPRIFEPFFRGKNSTGEIAGTGLGLSGARQIVEHHGGTITVESCEGAGSTFTLRLPLEPPPDLSAT